MNTTHPPVGPTEQELRQHFGDKLAIDAPLMRPAYTSVWALEDGTLLWDWKNGYSPIGEEPAEIIAPKRTEKAIVYMTGRQATSKSFLIELFENALELHRADYINFTDLSRAIGSARKQAVYAVVDQRYDPDFARMLEQYATGKGLRFININLIQNISCS